jgi:hypothetical protein
VATLKAAKAPPTSPALESETTLKTFLLKQRRWLAAGAAVPTHLDPAFLISRSDNASSKEVAVRLLERLLNIQISGVEHRTRNNNFNRGQHLIISIGAQRIIPKQA